MLGRISDSGQDADGKVWNHGSIVRTAQEKFAKNDKFTTLVTVTDSLSYTDAAHYSSSGYLKLGQRFAEAMVKLQQLSE